MIKRIVYLVFFSIVFALTSTLDVQAAEVSMTLTNAKTSYKVGEKIAISVKISNSSKANKDFVLVSNFNSVEQIGSALLVPNNISLKAGETRQITVLDRVIDNSFSSKDYVLKVDLLEGSANVASLTHNFSLSNKVVVVPVSFSIQLCKDVECANPKRVYELGDSVYIKVSSEQTDLSYIYTIVSPDNSENHVDANIPYLPVQAGSYALKVLAKNSQGQQLELQESFAVNSPEQLAEIQENSDCVVDNQCKDGENLLNCPQDCNQVVKDNSTLIIAFAVVLSGLVIAVTALVVLKVRQNKKKAKESILN